jgi:hypothetical protein
MKVRTALGALFGALALTAGLVVSAGSAGATAPFPTPRGHDGGDINCTNVTTCTGAGGVSVPPPTGIGTTCTTFPCVLDPNGTLDTDPAHHGGLGGHFYPGYPGGIGGLGLGGGVLGLGGLDLLNGNTIIVDGQSVPVCQYQQWDGPLGFYPHFGGAHGGWLAAHQLNELRWRQLVQQANCANSLNGLNLLNGNLIDLGGLGVLGGGTANVCQYNNWNDFNGWGAHQFGGHWSPFGQHWGGQLNGGGWNQLRLRAHCQPQIVIVNGGTTTVEQAPPAPVAPPVPADVPTPEAAPAPLTGSGQYHYPSSAPNTGDGSLAG